MSDLAVHPLFLQAVRLQEQGNQSGAVALYHQLQRQGKTGALLLYNLGLALLAMDNPEEAALAFAEAAEMDPLDPDCWYNLGLTLKRLGLFTQSREAYVKARDLRPNDPEIWYNLGCCLQDGGSLQAAIHAYQEVVRLQPDHLPAWNNLACSAQQHGDHQLARQAYGQVVALDPERAAARYMLAVLDGRQVQAPPKEYIQELFDGYAASFDTSLQDRLGYRTPTLLARLLQQVAGNRRYVRLLDLGCGTGLSGQAFAFMADQLTGVDLSAAMLARAREKEVYQELVIADMVGYLRTCNERAFDLVICVDTLPYLGDLQEIICQMARLLAVDGWLALSVELGLAPGYVLQRSGRYCHHPDYVVQVLERADLQVAAKKEVAIRREGAAWIRGLLVTAFRSSG